MMTGAEIFRDYGIRPPVYKYVLAIGETPGMSNDDLSRVVRVSPQLAGRVSANLLAAGVIEDWNEGSPTLKRKWVLSHPELLDEVRRLLGKE